MAFSETVEAEIKRRNDAAGAPVLEVLASFPTNGSGEVVLVSRRAPTRLSVVLVEANKNCFLALDRLLEIEPRTQKADR